jgi:hypothetical protein
MGLSVQRCDSWPVIQGLRNVRQWTASLEVGYEDRRSEKKKECLAKAVSVDGDEIFIITVDGTDCAIWEHKHNTLPKRYFSKKKNRAAVKYLVALAIFSPHVVFVDGPFPAGQFNDIAAFRSRLEHSTGWPTR